MPFGCRVERNIQIWKVQIPHIVYNFPGNIEESIDELWSLLCKAQDKSKLLPESKQLLLSAFGKRREEDISASMTFAYTILGKSCISTF